MLVRKLGKSHQPSTIQSSIRIEYLSGFSKRKPILPNSIGKINAFVNESIRLFCKFSVETGVKWSRVKGGIVTEIDCQPPYYCKDPSTKFQIWRVSLEDKGRYQCQHKLDPTNNTYYIDLNVELAPNWIHPPARSYLVIEKQTKKLEIHAFASSVPPPKFNLYLGNTLLSCMWLF